MWCILAFIFSNLFSLLIAFMYGQLRGIANTKKWYEDKDEQLTEAKEILTKLLEEEKNNMYWEMNGSDKSSYYEVRKQAEQFLKEAEK